MNHHRRLQTRSRRPGSASPIDHNANIARRKAAKVRLKRWRDNVRSLYRAGRVAKVHPFATTFTGIRKVERGTPEHAALTAQMRERFPDAPQRVRRQEVFGEFIEPTPDTSIALDRWGEPLGRKSDYQLATDAA